MKRSALSFAGVPALDYGARLYSVVTGRWLSQDPLGEEYYWLSPYSYCAGNPVDFVDPDGEKRKVVYNNRTQTVVIQATYYHNIGITASLTSALSLYNNSSGITYINEEGQIYDVKFDLRAKRSSNPKESKNNDPIGNSVEISSDLGMDKNGNNRLGGTVGSRIMIEEDAVNEIIVLAHEIGHTLGAALPNPDGSDNHSSSGLMTSSIDNPKISGELDQKSVDEIITQGVGPVEYKNTFIEVILNLFKK